MIFISPKSALIGIVLAACATSSAWSDEAFEKVSDLVYAQRGETNLKADVYVPKGEGAFPSVLMVHGGGWRFGSKLHMIGHARNLAKNGYVVVNINYRLAPKHKFPAQIEDCREAVRWMRQHADEYKIDTDRIAGYGYSAGAHLVCLLGVTESPKDKEMTSTRLQAVVGGGTPCDFQWVPKNASTLSYFLGGSRGEKPDVYREASPVSFVTKDDPPVFFFHGTEDRLVPRGSVDRMIKLLEEAGVNAKLHEIPDKGHLTAFVDKTAQDKAILFLNQVLKNSGASSR